jgi:hypothetical protein
LKSAFYENDYRCGAVPLLHDHKMSEIIEIIKKNDLDNKRIDLYETCDSLAQICVEQKLIGFDSTDLRYTVKNPFTSDVSSVDGLKTRSLFVLVHQKGIACTEKQSRRFRKELMLLKKRHISLVPLNPASKTESLVKSQNIAIHT